MLLINPPVLWNSVCLVNIFCVELISFLHLNKLGTFFNYIVLLVEVVHWLKAIFLIKKGKITTLFKMLVHNIFFLNPLIQFGSNFTHRVLAETRWTITLNNLSISEVTFAILTYTLSTEYLWLAAVQWSWTNIWIKGVKVV